MKTLEEVKNEIAIDHGQKNFHYWGLSEKGYRERADAFDEIAKRYALEAIKSDRERVVDSAKIIKTANGGSYMDASVDKQSILNLPIELP